MKLPESVTRAFGKAGLQLKKHSPEILVVAGIVGVVASAVMACKATPKVVKVVEEAKKNVETLHTAMEHPETLPANVTKEDCKKDLTIVYTQAGLNIAKLYAPAVGLGVLSITGILAGHNILHKRNVGLAAAYATVDKSFKNYRKNVVERFGEELDKELKYNIKAKEVEEVVVDEKGKEKTVKKTVKTMDGEPSEYARFFDVGQDGWQKDPEHNLWYLRVQQKQANDLLQARGYLFLNEVYDMLDIPRTKQGQIVGWIYKKEGNNAGDNFVDFGIYNMDRPKNRDFVNGYESTILLDFNVDGPILDLI